MSNQIERLRSDELTAIEDGVVRDRLDHTLKSLDERGAAQELIRQQYTGRYPFELLQNADDAASETSGGGMACFTLTESALVVADNGSGFGPEQIAAICSLGRSSKDPRKTIGYKGLGFKSVGEITHAPQIISGAVHFGFDDTRVRSEVAARTGPLPSGQRLPVYAFPFPMETDDLGPDAEVVSKLLADGFRTVVRLPFKEGIERRAVEDHLRLTLNSRLLLFLRSTDELQLAGTTHDFDAFATREPDDFATDVLLETNSVVEHWLVYRREAVIPSFDLVASLGEGWRSVERVSVAAAVPMDEDGLPTGGDPRPLHVYFPSEEATGLACILHGDFVLELDRRHISATPEAAPYNQWLAGELAQLMGDVAHDLADRHPGLVAPLKALAFRAPPSGFGTTCAEQIGQQFRAVPFIPCVDGAVRRPGEALVLPKSTPDPHDAHKHLDVADIGRLVIADVETNLVVRRFLVERLGVNNLELAEALGCLAPPGEPLDDYYSFLVAWADKTRIKVLAPLLADRPCVVTTSGEHVAPADRVFFPREQGIPIEATVNLPIRIAAVPEVDGLRELLLAAGVSRFEWRGLIDRWISPLLRDPSTDAEVRDRALETLQLYFDTQGGGDQTIRTAVSRTLLLASSQDGTVNDLRPADRLYFSSEWLGNDRLAEVYGPFGEAEFLSRPAPRDTEVREKTRSFLSWLGVARRPRVSEVSTTVRDTYMTASRRQHPHAAVGDWWGRWLRSPGVVTAINCPQGHVESQQIRVSSAVDRLERLIESADRHRLRLLWKELAEGWGETYQRAMRATFYCQNTTHAGERSRTAPSLLAFMLEKGEWVPCVKARQPSVESPRSIWRLAADVPKHVAERVPVLDSALGGRGDVALAEALLVVDAARPRLDDLVSLLGRLSDEAASSPDEELAAGVPEAARWAMRRLNEELPGAETLPSIDLLARKAGQQVFCAEPLVADDPLLAETFQSDYPILDGDRGLNKLHKALGLRSLDDEVQVLPVPVDPMPDDRIRIQGEIQRAAPFLVAVAAAQARSRVDDVVRGVRNLELHVCRALVLRYEFDGATRERTEAVSWIAPRIEAVGRRRRIGTAYLELDGGGQPDWYTFGPQFADFVGVPTQGDAFALLLAGDDRTRRQYLSARHIPLEALDEARIQLQLPLDEDAVDVLIAEVVNAASSEDSRSLSAGSPADTSAQPAGTATSSSVRPSLGRPSNGRSERTIEFPALVLEGGLMRDAAPGEKLVPSKRGVMGGGGLGPAGPVDHEHHQHVQREIGRRGEKFAVSKERERLASYGIDPDVVFWRSETHEFAPYDIESLDTDGQAIYIEVKATADPDPQTPFNISEAELAWALAKRSRYYIYRVTDAHTAEPTVSRFQDPMGWLADGRATVRLSDARMQFSITFDEGL